MTVSRLFVCCFAVTAMLGGCKKNDFTPVKVTYAVKSADSSVLRITYHSDYFYDSGVEKPVDRLGTGGYWVASHIADGPEDYSIRVEYLDSAYPETDYRVYVVFNDSLFVDSAVFDHSVPLVELYGTVTN